MFKEKKIAPNIVDASIMIFGLILTYLLFSVFEGRDYNIALRVSPIDIIWHTPIASWHMPTFFVLVAMAIIGYGFLRKFKLKMPPLIIVICISCMFIGIIIGIVWMIQLSKHFDNFEVRFMCLFAFNYIVCCFALIMKVIKDYTEDIEKKEYKNPILNKFNKLLENSRNWPILAILLIMPILTIAIIILVLFGQQPTAIIKAFTETSDWFLSQKVSPQTTYEKTGHYLCTVSIRGHERIVKPLRLGIRNNEKIIVNRQLCVANAFEQLIQVNVPRIHRIIRNIYDKYGYPLSKHIDTPIRADIVYILMKPLEWIFLVVLYLFDKKLEDRIAKQYSTFS